MVELASFWEETLILERDFDCSALLQGSRLKGFWFRDIGLGFRDRGLGFGDIGLGFRDIGLGFRDLGLGFSDRGLGFRV